ncbi:glycosyltransferase family 4 protein [Maribacter sp. 2307ULW6-5]|uniref:glycosyltransferase family 4 protein n=1 Tax=Maribacter sp. 2307ULW6-5 TaxID=3386275 RepID=UPI0039BC779D
MMQKKTILLSAYACSPIKGSEEGRGWNWAVGLAELGYTVYCMTNFEDREHILAHHQETGLSNLHFVFVNLPFGLDRLLFDPSGKTVYLHYWLWKRKASKMAKKLHAKYRFDVAHHATYGSLQQGSALYDVEDCKIIFGPVGGGQMALPIFKGYFGKAWITELLRQRVSNFMLRSSTGLKKTIQRAAVIVSTNQETKALLEKHYDEAREKSHLATMYPIPKMYNALPYTDRGEEHKKLNIIWIGRLLPRKGLNLTLHALSLLPDSVPFELTVVGDGRHNHQIDTWSREYGLDKNKLNLVGKIPYSEVARYYKEADVMLFCSLRDTLGIQIMEAMAHSLPLVVLNISGARNLVPEACAIKIDPTETPGTAEAIANAIETLQKNPGLRKKMAKASHAHAMRNTWEKVILDFTQRHYE